MSAQPPIASGAYGLRLTGLPGGERHLHPVPAQWPELRLAFSCGSAEAPLDAGTIQIESGRADLWLAEAGRIELLRDPLSVHFTTPQPLSPEAVLHPFLGLPAAIASRWLGRAAFHGGAFAHAGLAWALLGHREAGKSATLGQLLRCGSTVLSDDVLVVDRGGLYAGPRTIDLRSEAAGLVGGVPLGRVGNRERWRLRPPAAPPQLPLGGFVGLEWGSPARLEPLGAEERLAMLVAASALRPTDELGPLLLELIARPAWRFVRPRRLDRLPALIGQLLETLDAAEGVA